MWPITSYWLVEAKKFDFDYSNTYPEQLETGYEKSPVKKDLDEIKRMLLKFKIDWNIIKKDIKNAESTLNQSSRN